MRHLRLSLALGLLTAVGCSGSGLPENRMAQNPVGGLPVEAVALDGAGGEPRADRRPAQDKPVPRKIVYNGRCEVIVDDFDGAEAGLHALLKERGGYVAKSEIHGTPGAPRSGTWTVRVPAARFEDFLDAVSRLGELRFSGTDSNDITDAYYDLQAHVKNDQAREEALRKLYQEKVASSKLEDLLAVDRELSAVRGRIDEQTGRLQRWDKEVAYSTVVVTLHDRKDYRSPIVPDFGTSLGRTFQASVEALVATGKFLVLAAVAVAPWLLVVALLVTPVWLRVRRRRRAVNPQAGS